MSNDHLKKVRTHFPDRLCRWLIFPKMQENRAHFGIVWSNDCRLFSIGGQTGPNKSTQSVEMLSFSGMDAKPLANGTWTFVAPLRKPRQSHAAAFIGGKVVVAGGIAECGVECFNLPTDGNASGQWTSIYPLPEPLSIIALLPVDNCLIGICMSILSFTSKN